MNFYAHYIGDYDRDTADLSWDEDLAYRRLLAAYYATEEPLANDPERLASIARTRTKAHLAAIQAVVRRFFFLGKDGKLHNARADIEIRKARKRIRAAKENGTKGGRKPTGLPSGNPVGKRPQSSPTPTSPKGEGLGGGSGGIAPNPQLPTAVDSASKSGRLRINAGPTPIGELVKVPA